MPFIMWNVKIIHLPGALVIGHVSPFDQVMHITILVKTVRKKSQKELKIFVTFLYRLIVSYSGLNNMRITNNLK